VPFVAASVDQLRVGDEVSVTSFDRYGEALGNLHFTGQITEIRSPRGILVMEHGDPSPTNYVFDGPLGHIHKRTWNVLSRNLEPEADAPRPGDRIALVRRREGVVREITSEHVRFEDGSVYSPADHLTDDWSGWTQTIEIIERSPEPLTDAEKLAAIKALIEEDAEWAEAGAEVSCAGYKVTDDGCYAATLAAKIADVLK
jgi:hypothetical protein